MNLDSLYCPPEGAMQFEVTRGPDGEDVSIPIWVWAEPVTKMIHGDGCKCDQGWEFLRLCVEPTPLLRRSAVTKPGPPIIVCTCIGKLVE